VPRGGGDLVFSGRRHARRHEAADPLARRHADLRRLPAGAARRGGAGRALARRDIASLPQHRWRPPAATTAAGPAVRRVQPYGPTQASVVTSSALVEPGSDDRPPSIGVPIANTQVYILDEHGRLAPIGAPGELYIGGAGVALGYLRSKDLTRERFVESPAVPGARLSRSGDRVRFRPDGRLRNCLDVRRSPSAAAFAPDGGKADRGDIAAEIAALDPEDVWALAERAAPAHRIRLSWARADDRGRFDVIIEAPGHPIAAPAPDLWGSRSNSSPIPRSTPTSCHGTKHGSAPISSSGFLATCCR
jgi:acyl-CoA synthetase (AMP-forming)/AMP-acid ligase II